MFLIRLLGKKNRKRRYRTEFKNLYWEIKALMKKLIFVIRSIQIGSTVKWFLLKYFTQFRTWKFNVLGQRMFLDLRVVGISRALAFYGTREEDMLRIVRDVVKPGMQVFDLGANIGFYSMEMIRLLDGQGKVLSVEPDPRNLPILKRNLQLVADGNVSVLFEGAVGEKNEDGYVSPADKSNLTTVSNFSKSKEDTPICMRTVESLAAEHLAGRVDLVRMDIEGYEVEVLGAALRFFEKLESCNILFECHPNTYNEAHSLKEVLSDYFGVGFKVSTMVCTEHGRCLLEKHGITFEKHVYSDGFDRFFYKDIPNSLVLETAHYQPKAVRYMLLTKR